MQPPLTHVEVRVLGSLVEKAATTPDTYPLTLSALVAACNQLSNREPVMQLDEDTVSSAIVTLRRRSLLRAIQPAGSRVTKYQHLLNEALDLDVAELAVVCVLMLRLHPALHLSPHAPSRISNGACSNSNRNWPTCVPSFRHSRRSSAEQARQRLR